MYRRTCSATCSTMPASLVRISAAGVVRGVCVLFRRPAAGCDGRGELVLTGRRRVRVRYPHCGVVRRPQGSVADRNPPGPTWRGSSHRGTGGTAADRITPALRVSTDGAFRAATLLPLAHAQVGYRG